MRLLALALIALIGPPAAAGPVTPEAFRAMSEGRTLHFTLDGAPFGAEQFFSDRRSLWQFSDGSCAPGRWEAKGAQICFQYDADPAPVCWLFQEDGAGFKAQLVEDGAGTGLSLDLDRITPDPLPCPGPEVGS